MSRGDPLRVVIVGNGIAGVAVAGKLRELEPDPRHVSVSIFTREPYEYYARIRLPEVFESAMTAADLQTYRPEWYDERHITVHKSREVVAIRRSSKRIALKDGEEVAYDRLVLCTGADSFLPPIPGSHLEGVFTVREYGDAEAIRREVQKGARHAVVIGGGLLGLEAARHLRGEGLESLTIVEIASRLLPRQLDEPAAALLTRIMERLPARILLSARVTALLGDRRVSGLELADGTELPAETVLVSAGIRPRIELARAAGLAVNRGVVVDSSLRSGDPDIFVAGDLVEFDGIVWGIIPAALDHAPVVAGNLLGREPAAYHQTVPRNTLKVAGVHLTSMGNVLSADPDAAGFTVISRLDEAGERYEKYVVRDGLLAGSILLGSSQNLAFVNQHIGKPVSEEELRARPW